MGRWWRMLRGRSSFWVIGRNWKKNWESDRRRCGTAMGSSCRRCWMRIFIFRRIRFEGSLLAGLNRNVFPEEAKNADPQYAAGVVEQFLKDSLSQGVVGGAAYMTVHAGAARAALGMLPQRWFVGMVLMNMNCPPYLRT